MSKILVSHRDFKFLESLQQEVDVILTGGGAVQLYTGGAILTADIDVALLPDETEEDVSKALERRGYWKMGNIWLSREAVEGGALGVPLQLVGYYPHEIRQLEHGDLILRVVSLEYIIADRLAKCRRGLRTKGCLAALLMLRSYRDILDREKLKQHLKGFGVDESFLDERKLERLSG